MLENYAKSDLEVMVGKDEKILWQSRPEKKCFILEGIFNPLLPFALIWLLFDSFFIGAFIYGTKKAGVEEVVPFTAALISFFALHLMPVWIYLAGALLVFRRYKHTEYIVTDKGVYVSGGLFSYTCKMKPYTELSHINIHRGIIDQWQGVGDVVLTSGDMGPSYARSPIHHISGEGALTIADIPDYQKVFELVKQLQMDIYADTMYPNDLRPKENKGYHTEYKGL